MFAFLFKYISPLCVNHNFCQASTPLRLSWGFSAISFLASFPAILSFSFSNWLQAISLHGYYLQYQMNVKHLRSATQTKASELEQISSQLLFTTFFGLENIHLRRSRRGTQWIRTARTKKITVSDIEERSGFAQHVRNNLRWAILGLSKMATSSLDSLRLPFFWLQTLRQWSS